MSDREVNDLKYWLGFNRVNGIGPAKLRLLLDQYGDLSAAWQASTQQLAKLGIDKRALKNFVTIRDEIDLDVELEKTIRAGIDIVVWSSSNYPKFLKEIPSPPPVLYVKGKILPSDEWAVAIVGTRRFTVYGRQITQELAGSLVRNNVTIVSGLAKGIDAFAHQAALDSGGRTIAVLGSGFDNLYPAENRGLAERIIDGNGALITEYGLGTPPDARNFPARNRIISGLSLGVVVVEAGIRSGALITSSFALEQDREVFAVPGNVNSPASQGTNSLIQQGAKLVRSAEDVLEELNLTMVPQQAAMQQIVPDTAEEALLIEHLSHQPIHIDDLTRHAGLPSNLVGSTLTIMELKGMVIQVGGMNYVLAREPDPSYEINSEIGE